MARKWTSCFTKKFVINFLQQNNQFSPGVEQDAHEFLSCLLSNLHERVNRAIPIQNSNDKTNNTIEDLKNNLAEGDKVAAVAN